MDKPSLNTLGRHIQLLRTERGLSLSQLAADAGIAKSNLSRIEQGEGNPTLDTIWRLAMQLDVPFGNLVAPVSGAPLGEDGVEVHEAPLSRYTHPNYVFDDATFKEFVS